MQLGIGSCSSMRIWLLLREGQALVPLCSTVQSCCRRNALGAVLLAAGIAMLVLPGQGLLTILLGLMLVDFPGKRRAERALVARPNVFEALNWLRAKAGRPPLLPVGNAAESASGGPPRLGPGGSAP